MTDIVVKGRSLARLALRILITMAAGSALLLGGVANAASPVGVLTFDTLKVATVTALTVTPPGSFAVAAISMETLTATVSPPAAGSVQTKKSSFVDALRAAKHH